MTTEDLDRLEALHGAATKGEWTVEIEEYGASGSVSIPEINRILHDTDWADPLDFEQDQANAECIAAARNALPAIIAEVRRLQAECERLREYDWRLIAEAPRDGTGIEVAHAPSGFIRIVSWDITRDSWWLIGSFDFYAADYFTHFRHLRGPEGV